jgi:hypothetical protein
MASTSNAPQEANPGILTEMINSLNLQEPDTLEHEKTLADWYAYEPDCADCYGFKYIKTKGFVPSCTNASIKKYNWTFCSKAHYESVCGRYLANDLITILNAYVIVLEQANVFPNTRERFENEVYPYFLLKAVVGNTEHPHAPVELTFYSVEKLTEFYNITRHNPLERVKQFFEEHKEGFKNWHDICKGRNATALTLEAFQLLFDTPDPTDYSKIPIRYIVEPPFPRTRTVEAVSFLPFAVCYCMRRSVELFFTYISYLQE